MSNTIHPKGPLDQGNRYQGNVLGDDAPHPHVDATVQHRMLERTAK